MQHRFPENSYAYIPNVSHSDIAMNHECTPNTARATHDFHYQVNYSFSSNSNYILKDYGRRKGAHVSLQNSKMAATIRK
jgi:hypothetical protein